MMKAKTIEQQVADTILERDVATVTIDGTVYHVAPPSIATLILVSEIISTFPSIDAAALSEDLRTRQEQIFSLAIHNARHYRALGDVAAILILGARGLEEEIDTIEERPFFFGLLHRKVKVKKIIDRREKLAKAALESLTPTELFDLLINRIKTLDLGNFFALTTSLSEANVLRPTRGVEP